MVNLHFGSLGRLSSVGLVSVANLQSGISLNLPVQAPPPTTTAFVMPNLRTATRVPLKSATGTVVAPTATPAMLTLAAKVVADNTAAVAATGGDKSLPLPPATGLPSGMDPNGNFDVSAVLPGLIDQGAPNYTAPPPPPLSFWEANKTGILIAGAVTLVVLGGGIFFLKHK